MRVEKSGEMEQMRHEYDEETRVENRNQTSLWSEKVPKKHMMEKEEKQKVEAGGGR